MSDQLKLVNLNIEGNRHWETILPLLREQGPDVVCLQEVFEDQLPLLADFPHRVFLPNTRRPYWGDLTGPLKVFGITIASRLPISESHSHYYWHPGTELPTFINGTPEEKHQTYWHGYLAAEIIKGSSNFKIVTTHFTWTPDGMPNQYQRDDLKELKRMLADEGAHVLCGDFNIPRSVNELSKELLSGYTDFVPPEYESSLDPVMHRANHTPDEPRIRHFMVDYLLGTPEYYASHVPLICSVSDHCAISAALEKR